MLRTCPLFVALPCAAPAGSAPVAAAQPDTFAVALQVQMRKTATDRTVEELLRRELLGYDPEWISAVVGWIDEWELELC